MIQNVILYAISTLLVVMLGPLLAFFVKVKNISLQNTLRYFIFLTVLRAFYVLGFSYFLIINGGNVFTFLITFAIVYSLMLLPEVLIIAKILDGMKRR